MSHVSSACVTGGQQQAAELPAGLHIEDASVLAQPGKKSGEIKVIREGGAGVAYSWDAGKCAALSVASRCAPVCLGLYRSCVRSCSRNGSCSDHAACLMSCAQAILTSSSRQALCLATSPMTTGLGTSLMNTAPALVLACQEHCSACMNLIISNVLRGEWDRIGDVVGGPGSDDNTMAVSSKMHQGQQYDFVFDVDIEDGAPPKKLPFNCGGNPYDAADR